jgi:polyribonucleotide nucleotidyltransferase
VQSLEGLDTEEQKRYMHHYNMPPYSVGEAKNLRAPGRREIGHGALAERALEPVLPSVEEFPYAIRTVSEILSSNGSSSMAATCGSTMSLMDAGVPIKAPVAGIAMGLIKDEKTNKTAVLSDIQGLEDFLGDMDFKVCGTEKGITAIQMDIKIKGIDNKILTTALNQAKVGRMHILGKMFEAIDEPRKELSKYAPKIVSFNINPDAIRNVIGSGGKNINEIIKETGVKIDISDEGRVDVSSVDKAALERCKQIILTIAEPLKSGKNYEGKITRVLPIGAIVQVAPGVDGMIHISKLADKRVEKVEDIVNVGDSVTAEFLKEDDRGRRDFKLVKVNKDTLKSALKEVAASKKK